MAVLGLDIVESLYGDRAFNPVGQEVRINQVTFTVTGVMSQRGGTFISEDNVVFIPITTAQSRLASVRTRDGGFQVSTIFVEVETQEDINSARQEIVAYLDDAHDIVFADERDPDDFLGHDCGDFFASRRYWHHEYYAGIGHRTNTRNWLAEGSRRSEWGYFVAVFARKRGAIFDWGRARDWCGIYCGADWNGTL